MTPPKISTWKAEASIIVLSDVLPGVPSGKKKALFPMVSSLVAWKMDPIHSGILPRSSTSMKILMMRLKLITKNLSFMLSKPKKSTQLCVHNGTQRNQTS